MSLITVAVQCHNFQRRLCWMLSSLAQQTARDVALVDVAHLPRNGAPATEAVLDFFGADVRLKSSAWDDHGTFQKRGLVRNRQLAECATEWLLFADCDMVYHPEFFARLAAELSANHAKATHMLSSGRISNPQEAANELVDGAIGAAPVCVAEAFACASGLPRIVKRNVGAGFSQLINARHAPHGGYYVTPQENADWAWDGQYQKARSDFQFRKRLGRLGGARRDLPEWFSQNLIHLNHHRDKEAGRHLEEQR
ncbi:MAG: glycosyltransferase family 2 protein [Verrucomicrobia bacterium]|nr:glycosyltransferase family 2 protein [Verrucomicrobiota bacterium]